MRLPDLYFGVISESHFRVNTHFYKAEFSRVKFTVIPQWCGSFAELWEPITI